MGPGKMIAKALLICASIACLLPTVALAQGKAPVVVEGVTVTSIDVEQLLAKRFNINPSSGRYAEDADCPQHPTGGGFRAKTWCHHYTQFRDLAIDNISEYKIGEIDLSKLPVTRKDERIEFENRWGDSYPFKQNVTYRSHQGATVVLSEVLTKVKDYSSSFDVNATIFKSIGITTSDKIGRSVTYSLTKSKTDSLEEDFEISTILDFTVPSCYRRWAEYSDEKRNARIPVSIKGLISGRIVDWVPEARWENEVRKIDNNSKEDRSVVVNGYLDLAGSNRSLSIRLGEEKITDGGCASQRK
jgi:hypothetical protein